MADQWTAKTRKTARTVRENGILELRLTKKIGKGTTQIQVH